MSQSGIQVLRQMTTRLGCQVAGGVERHPGRCILRSTRISAPDFDGALEALAHGHKNCGYPTGWVIVGQGGTEKHIYSAVFAPDAQSAGACFVLVDMTDVHDFWDTVLLGYFTSLQEVMEGETPAISHALIEALLQQSGLKEPVDAVMT